MTIKITIPTPKTIARRRAAKKAAAYEQMITESQAKLAAIPVATSYTTIYA